MNDTVATRFRALRLEHGLTQAATAEKLGLSLSTYSLIERDRVDLPASPVLIAAADLYGVSVDYLLCRSDFRSGSGGEYISEATGLSDKAVSALIRAAGNEYLSSAVVGTIDMLLTRKNGILNSVYQYVSTIDPRTDDGSNLVTFTDGDAVEDVSVSHMLPADRLYFAALQYAILQDLDRLRAENKLRHKKNPLR